MTRMSVNNRLKSALASSDERSVQGMNVDLNSACLYVHIQVHVHVPRLKADPKCHSNSSSTADFAFQSNCFCSVFSALICLFRALFGRVGSAVLASAGGYFDVFRALGRVEHCQDFPLLRVGCAALPPRFCLGGAAFLTSFRSGAAVFLFLFWWCRPFHHLPWW